ncbi:MAG TPA: hypothetical protein VF701_07850 [Thermoanaerobaculia bacterium]
MIDRSISHYRIWRDAHWARRDPTLAALRDDPEFDRLFPSGESSW